MPDPLDPFGSDEFAFSPDEHEHTTPEPIDEEERESLLQDLADLADFRAALEPRGFRGVVIPCPDCEDDHYFSWSLLRESLEHILQEGEPRVHEPAFEPKLEDYVNWEYAKGFVDGLTESDADEDSGTGPQRSAPASTVEASRRLRRALATRGLSDAEVEAVLSEGGLPLE